jgi:PAS domain S-box-containing protein
LKYLAFEVNFNESLSPSVRLDNCNTSRRRRAHNHKIYTIVNVHTMDIHRYNEVIHGLATSAFKAYLGTKSYKTWRAYESGSMQSIRGSLLAVCSQASMSIPSFLSNSQSQGIVHHDSSCCPSARSDMDDDENDLSVTPWETRDPLTDRKPASSSQHHHTPDKEQPTFECDDCRTRALLAERIPKLSKQPPIAEPSAISALHVASSKSKFFAGENNAFEDCLEPAGSKKADDNGDQSTFVANRVATISMSRSISNDVVTEVIRQPDRAIGSDSAVYGLEARTTCKSCGSPLGRLTQESSVHKLEEQTSLSFAHSAFSLTAEENADSLVLLLGSTWLAMLVAGMESVSIAFSLLSVPPSGTPDKLAVTYPVVGLASASKTASVLSGSQRTGSDNFAEFLLQSKPSDSSLESNLPELKGDGDVKFVYVNKQFERDFGYRKTEIVGKSHRALFRAHIGSESKRPLSDGEEEFARTMTSGTDNNICVAFRRKNGRNTRSFAVIKALYDQNGVFRYVEHV